MYTPRFYKVADTYAIEQFIHKNGFATLICKGSEFPIGTHIPIELEMNEHGEKVLWGHISKGNAQWKLFEESPVVLVIFLSHVHSYISSSWYGRPNVSTLNYMSVHVQGRIKNIKGEKLRESVKRLTDKYERTSKNPVSLDTLTLSVHKQHNGVVGFEIRIEQMEAVSRLNQNRNEEDYENIIKELRLSNELRAALMADVMANYSKE